MNKAVLFLVLYLVFFPAVLVVRAYTNEEECGFCKNEPDCCAQIRQTKDATACEWPIRGYCKLDTCNQSEGNHQRCGWYWVFHNANDNEYHLGTNSPTGYGCMIGDSEATMRPRCDPTPIPTAQPTVTPYPTSRPPTPVPTRRVLPTATPYPTMLPLPTLPQPTAATYPAVSAVPTANPYQPPSATLPLIQIPTIPAACTSLAGTDTVTSVFTTFIQADRNLEQAINVRLQSLLNMFKPIMRL